MIILESVNRSSQNISSQAYLVTIVQNYVTNNISSYVMSSHLQFPICCCYPYILYILYMKKRKKSENKVWFVLLTSAFHILLYYCLCLNWFDEINIFGACENKTFSTIKRCTVTGDMRQVYEEETWDRRWKTGDMRQETDKRHQREDVRQERGKRRQETWDRRQETRDRRRETGYRKRETG